MIKTLKSNKILISILFIVCLIIIFNPSVYAESCLNAVSVWAFKVFPLLFPFFILTRLILSLSSIKPSFMDKFFSKAYHVPAGSFFVFFLSILCGYPMGAKLISGLFENKQISQTDAKKMLSFCSVSGPMFMIGTVGVAIFSSYTAGLIIFTSNLIACLINGLIYRAQASESKPQYLPKQNENILADSVYDSLISILMVGAYIILSFIIIDLLKETNILHVISKSICGVFYIRPHQNIVESVLCGAVEITRGIIDLSITNIPLKLKAILSSGLIGFGGFSVMLQSISFLSKSKINLRYMALQKITQSAISLLISIPLCLLFL